MFQCVMLRGLGRKILKIISIGIVIQELNTSINIVMKEIPLNREIHHLNAKFNDLFSSFPWKFRHCYYKVDKNSKLNLLKPKILFDIQLWQ